MSSRIFISYSHRGGGPGWKAKLLAALYIFEQHHLLDVWEDGKIRASSFWDDDITHAMSEARLAVFLLTPEAIDPRTESDPNYILHKELPYLKDRARRDKLPVFPVVCEPCAWKDRNESAWLHAIQAPNNSSALSALSEARQGRVLRQLVTDIALELSRVALAELTSTTGADGGRSESKPEGRTYLKEFPLTRGSGLREEKLIGREQELALLDLALAQPHTAIVSLIAWGGVGKTMLVQHWLQRLKNQGWFGAQRVYAWCFYSQGTREDRQASEDGFLAHALEWFGVQCEPTLSPRDKGRLIAKALLRERTLLILDGIEPLQYPPGPMVGQLRAPGVQALLKYLARKANETEHRGLCLVTTREPLADLGDFERRPNAAWGSVLRVNLGNLTEEAGAALLHHAGAKHAGAAEITPDDAELIAASKEVAGHALTLHLLGRFLARAHAGDIRRRDLVKFEEADRREQGGATFKMLAAFEAWFAKSGEFGARQLAILRMLGLFDRPADTGCIGALRKDPVIEGLTDALFATRPSASTGQYAVQPIVEEEWNTTAAFLADFGLLTIQTTTDDQGCLLDCHPLIREHFAKQLRASNPERFCCAHRRLYRHLKDSVADKPKPTIDDLQPLYEAIMHGAEAGLHQEACDSIFYERIRRGEDKYSWMELGAYADDLSALSRFFIVPWTHVEPELSPSDQAWVLAEAGFCLRLVGRLREAIEPTRSAHELTRHAGEWTNAATDANNLSELHLVLGDVEEAIHYAKMAVGAAAQTHDGSTQRDVLTTLGDAMHQRGANANALSLFNEAEAINGMLLFCLQGFQYCELLLATCERNAWLHTVLGSRKPSSWRESMALNTLASLQDVEGRNAEVLGLLDQVASGSKDVALHHLTLGNVSLYRAAHESSEPLRSAQLKLARGHLSAAVDGFRQPGAAEHLPRGLLSRGWLHVLGDDAQAGRADLDEAWDVAERGPMRLHMADIHLYRARLFYRDKRYPWRSPQADLAAAEKLINDCGYHRRDHDLADAKRAILLIG